MSWLNELDILAGYELPERSSNKMQDIHEIQNYLCTRANKFAHKMNNKHTHSYHTHTHAHTHLHTHTYTHTYTHTPTHKQTYIHTVITHNIPKPTHSLELKANIIIIK